MTEQEQSLRQELEVARNNVFDAQEILAKAVEAQAVVMNALKELVTQRQVTV